MEKEEGLCLSKGDVGLASEGDVGRDLGLESKGNAMQWNAMECNAMQCNARLCNAMQCLN